MPMTKVDNEHDQLVSMLNHLLDEREILSRENEYLKAKLNQSILLETIKEMKKERDILFKLLSNLTINNNKDKRSKFIKHHNKENKSVDYNNSSTLSRHNPSSMMNPARVHRLKSNIEQQQQQQPHPTIVYSMKNSDGLSSLSTTHTKHSQTNKKILVYKTPTQEFNTLIRQHDIQLKHSQNSPFQYYRSQSLQDLT